MTMEMDYTKKLVLENGDEYYGFSFGCDCERVCELVFNTSVVGYQEILSDPSYTYQAVVMTYPLIGNYGMAAEDYETEIPTIGALVVHEVNSEPSNFRSVNTLDEVMRKFEIPGIYGLDTRKLTRFIRDFGSCKVLICDASKAKEEALKILSETEIKKDAVELVSTKKIKVLEPLEARYHVVAIDCGMKKNIVRSLNKRGCKVTIVPYDTPVEKIAELKPDGVFISNGPGDPVDVAATISTIKGLIGKYPIFGICLGHQIISLAYGAKTYKLKFGHRGGNHPVRCLATNKIEITSQNHSYAVDEESLKITPLKVTHMNILDNTVEGVECEKDKVFSVQYHPESTPGPHDSAYLFDKFIKIMEEERQNAQR